MTRTQQEHHNNLINEFGFENKQTFGSGGFLFLDDLMGSDSDIARIARVSYGEGTKTVSDDTALIRRLIKDNHSSPLQQAQIRIFVRAPLHVVAQMRTHRTFQYAQTNQYSLRYSTAIDEMETIAPDAWRAQSSSNKQGSAGFVTEWPLNRQHPNAHPAYDDDQAGRFLSSRQQELHSLSREVYKERLDFGVARELARIDLPCSNYTELFFTVDLHNLLHFLTLRLDPHAQLEIRQLAQCLDNIVKAWVPHTWQAYQDYKMNAVTFSAQELSLLGDLLQGGPFSGQFLEWAPDARVQLFKQHGITSLNERVGFVNKIRNITGIS